MSLIELILEKAMKSIEKNGRRKNGKYGKNTLKGEKNINRDSELAKANTLF